MAELLTQQAIAELLDLDTRQIRNLQKQGLPMRRVKGAPRYPWPAGLQWYLAHKVELATKRAGPKALEEATLRKLEAQARLHEIDVEKAEGTLVTLDYAQAQLEAVLQRVRAKLLNFASRNAPQFVGIRGTAEAQAKLHEAIVDVMSALAEIGEDPELDPEDEEEDDEGAEPDAPASSA